jgi:hypothetical protein
MASEVRPGSMLKPSRNARTRVQSGSSLSGVRSYASQRSARTRRRAARRGRTTGSKSWSAASRIRTSIRYVGSTVPASTRLMVEAGTPARSASARTDNPAAWRAPEIRSEACFIAVSIYATVPDGQYLKSVGVQDLRRPVEGAGITFIEGGDNGLDSGSSEGPRQAVNQISQQPQGFFECAPWDSNPEPAD